jgi:hypothetical protein
MIKVTVEDGGGTNANFSISGDSLSGYWLEMNMSDAQFVDDYFLEEMVLAINSMTKEA